MRGKTLQDLAVEIERQAETKRDFIAPAKKLAMDLVPVHEAPIGTVKPIVTLANGKVTGFGITKTMHSQLATRLEIPAAYYDKCRDESPALLRSNVNHWLSVSDRKFMLRTLDGNARALLSDRYRPLDNQDLAEAVLPIISDKRWEIRDCDITEQRLYIKVVSKDLQAVVARRGHGGDHLVHPGLTISNSEIGNGMVRVAPSLHWPHCFNIAMMDELATNRVHTGRKDVRFGDIATEFFKDETRKQDDKAFWMKVRDVVNATVTQDLFNLMVQKFREATEAAIDGNVIDVVELTGKKYGLGEGERTSVLKHLIEGGDLSLYGLSGAITKAAQDDSVDYDRGTELEKIGGGIVELSKSDWKVLQGA